MNENEKIYCVQQYRGKLIRKRAAKRLLIKMCYWTATTIIILLVINRMIEVIVWR